MLRRLRAKIVSVYEVGHRCTGSVNRHDGLLYYTLFESAIFRHTRNMHKRH